MLKAVHSFVCTCTYILFCRSRPIVKMVALGKEGEDTGKLGGGRGGEGRGKREEEGQRRKDRGGKREERETGGGRTRGLISKPE